MGGSRRDMKDLPRAAQKVLGDELHNVQWGALPKSWRPMPSVGPGVIEIRVRAGGVYRLLHVASVADCIYVLHAFEKKTRKTSKFDVALARARFRSIRRFTRED